MSHPPRFQPAVGAGAHRGGHHWCARAPQLDAAWSPIALRRVLSRAHAGVRPRRAEDVWAPVGLPVLRGRAGAPYLWVREGWVLMWRGGGPGTSRAKDELLLRPPGAMTDLGSGIPVRVAAASEGPGQVTLRAVGGGTFAVTRAGVRVGFARLIGGQAIEWDGSTVRLPSPVPPGHGVAGMTITGQPTGTLRLIEVTTIPLPEARLGTAPDQPSRRRGHRGPADWMPPTFGLSRRRGRATGRESVLERRRDVRPDPGGRIAGGFAADRRAVRGAGRAATGRERGLRLDRLARALRLLDVVAPGEQPRGLFTGESALDQGLRSSLR